MNEFNSFITSWESRVHDTFYTIGLGSYYRSFYWNVGIQVCYNKELILSDCNLEDERVFAEGIMQLTISECKCVGPSIYSVDGLKKLRIEGCGGIEYILK